MQSTTPQHELNIAAVSQDADDGSVVEDRYYKYIKYKQLSEEDKANLKEKRKSRGHQPNDKNGAHKDNNTGRNLKRSKNACNFSSLQQQTKQLTCTVAKMATSLCANDPNPSDSEDSAEKETVTTRIELTLLSPVKIRNTDIEILLLST